MKLAHSAACLAFTVFLQLVSAQGRIIVNNDEWTFTSAGYASQPISTPIFASNVAAWFTGGGPGNFLAYSGNFGVASPQLASTMTGLGHSWTVSTALPFTLATLQNYDAVFLAGSSGSGAANAGVLIAYVMGGGNVYLAGGTGGFAGGAAGEATAWAPFLNAFGLALAPTFNGQVTAAITSSHPVFAGVGSLFFSNGNNVLLTGTADPEITLGGAASNPNLFGFFDAPRRYQVNQPSATLSIGSLTGTPFVLAPPGGAVGTINISSTVPAAPWDLALTTPESPVAIGAGATLLPDGQVVNLLLSAPSFFLANGGFATGPLASPLAVPYSLPPGFPQISAQLVVLDPAQLLGVALSQPIRIVP